MMRMAPPQQHIGAREHFVGQAVLRFVERGGADDHVLIFAQEVGDGAVNAVGVESGNLGHLLFVTEFIPNGYANHGIGLLAA